MGYNKLEHDTIIPDQLQDSTFSGVFGSYTNFLTPCLKGLLYKLC